MKHVLIVDNEPNVIRVLQLMLERAGHRVSSAPNGEIALAQVLAEAPDALITDIQMPRMNGRELVRAIQERLPERAFDIFVMTSMTEREEREWVRAVPRVEFLEKPVSPRHVVARLAMAFAATTSAPGARDA